MADFALELDFFIRNFWLDAKLVGRFEWRYDGCTNCRLVFHDGIVGVLILLILLVEIVQKIVEHLLVGIACDLGLFWAHLFLWPADGLELRLRIFGGVLVALERRHHVVLGQLDLSCHFAVALGVLTAQLMQRPFLIIQIFAFQVVIRLLGNPEIVILVGLGCFHLGVDAICHLWEGVLLVADHLLVIHDHGTDALE